MAMAAKERAVKMQMIPGSIKSTWRMELKSSFNKVALLFFVRDIYIFWSKFLKNPQLTDKFSISVCICVGPNTFLLVTQILAHYQHLIHVYQLCIVATATYRTQVMALKPNWLNSVYSMLCLCK